MSIDRTRLISGFPDIAGASLSAFLSRASVFALAGILISQSALTHAAYAAPAASPKSKSIVSPDMPVLLEADNIVYHREEALAVAKGNVVVTQGETILLADQLSYYQDTDRLVAEGHVSVLEPSGNVYFADTAELQTQMKTGVIHQIQARLSDNSLFAAKQGKRLNDHQTELEEAVYSPCLVKCADGSPKTPLWQIEANHVLIDSEAQRVTYKNAFFDIYGVPVLYTPYMAHSTPGADNKSGLLLPQYSHNTNLGSTYSIPVYLVLGQDKDVTLTPIITSNDGVVLFGEYRQRFDSGTINIRGSATNPSDRDAAGNRTSGTNWRGHINAEGRFVLNEDWNWGFDIKRATDDTYLRRYQFSNETLLTSRLYTQGLNFLNTGRLSYASIQALTFQGLTAQDIRERMPFVAPLADFEYQTNQLENGSRFTFSGNAMSLMRDEGADSRRLSATAKWALPYTTEGGQIWELASSLRTDLYYVNDVVTGAPSAYDGTVGRVIPQASLGWRYPFIKRMESSSLVVEPTVNLIASPYGGNKVKIPNEDSLTSQFSDLNLFSDNRFAGYDRIETGPRANYGMRAHLGFAGDKYANLELGQNYHLENDPLFPLSNDLDSKFSDYVGAFAAHYAPVDFAYRFRMDKENFSLRRQEVDSTFTFGWVTLSAAYLNLNDDVVIGSREEVYGGTSFRLNDQWTLGLNARRNLNEDTAINTGLNLDFHNECLHVMTFVGRDATFDRDIKPATTFRLQIGLKNLE